MLSSLGLYSNLVIRVKQVCRRSPVRLHWAQVSAEELAGGGRSEPWLWSPGASWVTLNVASAAPAFSSSTELRGISSHWSQEQTQWEVTCKGVPGCVPCGGVRGCHGGEGGRSLFLCLCLPHLLPLCMGLGGPGFPTCRVIRNPKLPGIVRRHPTADGKLVSKNVVLSNIFYNKKQLLIIDR